MKAQSKLLKKIIDSRDYLEIPSKGSSMFPMIREGNICVFTRFNHGELRKGDILLFESKDGSLTGHRYLRMIKREGQMWVTCKGDTNLYPDEPIRLDLIIGKLVKIKRNEQVILMNKRSVQIYSHILSYSRAIPSLLHLYVHKIPKKRNGKANEDSSIY